MNRSLRHFLGLSTLVVGSLALSACAGMSERSKATAVGAAVGGVAGSVLTNGSPVGAVGGAVIGGVIGNDAKKK